MPWIVAVVWKSIISVDVMSFSLMTNSALWRSIEIHTQFTQFRLSLNTNDVLRFFSVSVWMIGQTFTRYYRQSMFVFSVSLSYSRFICFVFNFSCSLLSSSLVLVNRFKCACLFALGVPGQRFSIALIFIWFLLRFVFFGVANYLHMDTSTRLSFAYLPGIDEKSIGFVFTITHDKCERKQFIRSLLHSF